MDAIMSGEATPAQIAGFLVALRAEGRDRGRDRRLRRGDAGARAAGAAAARTTWSTRAGTGGDGAQHDQHLDRRGARRGGGRRRRCQARQPRSLVGLADRPTCSRRSASSSSLSTERRSRARSTSSASASSSRRRTIPRMRHAAPVRRELAARTVFNVLGPLTNPAGARAQVVGVYAPELVRTIAEVLAQLGATPRLRRPRRRRDRRALACRAELRLRGRQRRGPRARHRPARTRTSARATRATCGAARPTTTPPRSAPFSRVRTAAVGRDPAQCRRRDRGRRARQTTCARGSSSRSEAVDSGAAAARLDELIMFSQGEGAA